MTAEKRKHLQGICKPACRTGRFRLRSKSTIILFVIILTAAFFRFYNSRWGESFFFHPDEGNIARSVAQLKWPQLHPHFFAYGHFSIYLAYFLNQLISFAQNLNFLPQVPFPQAAYTLRFLSALESVLLIGVVFLIARKIYSPAAGLITAALTAFTPGLIQAAHFGTTEAMLTLILFAVLYLSLKLLEKNDPKKNFFYLAVLLGIGLATKINSLVFFSFPLVALTLKTGFRPRKIWQQKNNFFLLGACFILAIIILIIASPYQILEWENFRGTTFYEISVAQGKSPVFYTRQFIDTRPIIFQLLKVFPFALGPFVEISGLAGLVATFLFLKLKKPPFIKKQKLLLVWAFLIYCPVSLLTFTKWTRFIVPLLPFFSLFSLEILTFLTKSPIKKTVTYFLVSTSFLFSLAFFQVYTQNDIRLTASEWMATNLPAQSHLFNEAGNVVDLPLKGQFQTKTFHFYGLDEKPTAFPELINSLSQAEYLVIPSRRIFADHNPRDFPITACYYQLLFSGQLGFEKIKTFTSYPTLKIGSLSLEFPDEIAEETWTVFDHPVIRIYQKKSAYSLEIFNQLFDHCLNQLK